MVRVPCLITVAAGVLAPGHLGELTRCLPFELANDVLVRTKTMQRRVRALPSRTWIYFVLAMTLFPGIGYLRAWDKMTAALEDPDLARPSEKALRDLRRIDARIREARKKAGTAVRASGTSLTGLFGVGPVVAAAVIGDVRDVSASPDGTASPPITAPRPSRCPPGRARSTG